MQFGTLAAFNRRFVGRVGLSFRGQGCYPLAMPIVGKERDMHMFRTTVSEFAEQAKKRNFPPQARIRVIVEDERSRLSHTIPSAPVVRADAALLEAIRRPNLLSSRGDVVETLRDIRDNADT